MNLTFISSAPQTSKGSIPCSLWFGSFRTWFVSFRTDIAYGLDHFVVCRALRFIKRTSGMMLLPNFLEIACKDIVVEYQDDVLF